MKTLALAALLVLPAAARAQPAGLVNAKVSTRPVAAGTLSAEVRALSAGDARWLAWEVPSLPNDHVCCYGSIHGDGVRGLCCGGCALESNRAFTFGGRATTAAPLEGARVEVFVRTDHGSVTAVRTFSPDCGVDAEGRPVVWLTGVPPEESVAFLATLVNEELEEKALAAVALHATPAAERSLLRFARRDPDSDVRGHALFWLAQRAGEKAAAAIVDAITDDPDAEVKEQAVFALSQLPRDRAVSELIRVARTTRIREVKERAIFWLGQTKDPRALDYIEEILAR